MGFSSSGGSGAQYEGLPKEFRPYVEEQLKNVNTAFDTGQLAHVEGLTPEQQDAFNRKLEIGQRGGVLDQIAADSYGAGQAYRDAAAGQGLFGADALGKQAAALEDTIGRATANTLGKMNTGAALGGSLGSARNQTSTQEALTRVGADIASQELNARREASLKGAQGTIDSGSKVGQQFGAGISATEGVGSALQQQKQNEADATHQALSRVFGFYGSPALGREGVSSERSKTFSK